MEPGELLSYAMKSCGAPCLSCETQKKNVVGDIDKVLGNWRVVCTVPIH